MFRTLTLTFATLLAFLVPMTANAQYIQQTTTSGSSWSQSSSWSSTSGPNGTTFQQQSQGSRQSWGQTTTTGVGGAGYISNTQGYNNQASWSQSSGIATNQYGQTMMQRQQAGSFQNQTFQQTQGNLYGTQFGGGSQQIQGGSFQRGQRIIYP